MRGAGASLKVCIARDSPLMRNEGATCVEFTLLRAQLYAYGTGWRLGLTDAMCFPYEAFPLCDGCSTGWPDGAGAVAGYLRGDPERGTPRWTSDNHRAGF